MTPNLGCDSDRVSVQAKANQTSRHVQRRVPNLTPTSVHNRLTLPSKEAGDQKAERLSLRLKAMDRAISDHWIMQKLTDGKEA